MMTMTTTTTTTKTTKTTKILVTGDQGFVGSHFLKSVGGTGLSEICDNPNLLEIEPIIAAIKEFSPDHIVHLAALTSVPQSFADPLATYNINFIATHNLLHGLKTIGFAGRLLFVGSGDMYGRVEAVQMPITEAQPLRPRSPYTVSKVAAEALCYYWSQIEPLQIVLARPFNHIGPGQDTRFVIADFAKQLVEVSLGRRSPVIEVGDIDVRRDFTDVRDVVRAYGLLLEHGQNGEVYNICSGQSRSVRDALNFMAEILDIQVEIKVDPQRLRANEHRAVWGSNQKLVSQLGWAPTISFDDSLTAVVRYWQDRLGSEQ